MPNSLNKWDWRFLRLAAEVAKWSKDPSTQVGSVIVNAKNQVLSLGFNGFPRGISDDFRLQDRTIKYEMVVHAEANALLHAKEDVEGATLYLWPFLSCSRCAALVIQSGIKRVVAPEATPEQLERWGDAFKLSHDMFYEAKVKVDIVGLHIIANSMKDI